MVQRRVDGGRSLDEGRKKMSGGEQETDLGERAERASSLRLWASDFMQLWPGAVENGVGVVPR